MTLNKGPDVLCRYAALKSEIFLSPQHDKSPIPLTPKRLQKPTIVASTMKGPFPSQCSHLGAEMALRTQRNSTLSLIFLSISTQRIFFEMHTCLYNKLGEINFTNSYPQKEHTSSNHAFLIVVYIL